MSKLSQRKRRLRVETDAAVFSRGARPIIVELFPTYMTLKPKGLRKAFQLTYTYALSMAAMADALATKRARAATKKN